MSTFLFTSFKSLLPQMSIKSWSEKLVTRASGSNKQMFCVFRSNCCSEYTCWKQETKWVGLSFVVQICLGRHIFWKNAKLSRWCLVFLKLVLPNGKMINVYDIIWIIYGVEWPEMNELNARGTSGRYSMYFFFASNLCVPELFGIIYVWTSCLICLSSRTVK